MDVTRDRPGGRAGTPSRRGVWARLTGNPVYLSITGPLLATERRRFWLLALFPLFWIFAMHLGPIVQMFQISFLDAYPPSSGQTPSWTLDNWAQFFSNPIHVSTFVRTFVFAATLTFITLIIMYPVAYYIAKLVPADRRLLFLLLLLVPFWAGEIVRTYAIMILLGNRGFVNIVLDWMGLIDRPIPFMYTNFSLGMGVIYLTSLYMLLPLYSALEKIPNNYLEAASDLGAGAFTRFRRIILPLSRDGIASGCTLVFLLSTGYYATPVLLGGPNTTVFAQTVARFFHVAGDQWPVGAAFSSIMLISALTLTGIFLKVMGRKGGGLLK
ncbi:ABC transporter permease [Fodinicurvata sp. EGI_FJ10296]|uniref:ABC transporter permease n=1 Tax=Fodinicurvata sp. EGI_FJ10296 TaxID=3231908 RepID=UPI0034555A38